MLRLTAAGKIGDDFVVVVFFLVLDFFLICSTCVSVSVRRFFSLLFSTLFFPLQLDKRSEQEKKKRQVQ
jgi:hypothetical protein